MVKYILSLSKPYGLLSIESENEDELLRSVHKFRKVGASVDRLFVSDIEPSPDIVVSTKDLANAQKVLAALSIADRPLERKEYIRVSSKLGVPIGWWNGSNFQRDLKKLGSGLVAKSLFNGKNVLKLTTLGKRYVHSLLSNVNQ